MTTPWYEDVPQERPHWWDTVEPQHSIHRESVRWTTPGQTLVGRVVGVQDVRVTHAPGAKHGKKRVYFFDVADGRKLLIWGTGALNDWFACHPMLLSRPVRIRYLGAFVDRQGHTHLRFLIRPVNRTHRPVERAKGRS